MFFSFDGIDGVGKSTQMALFVEELRSRGHDVVTCRDPGSTQLGEAIREILLRDMQTPICITSEMFLYMAARAQMVHEIISPALSAGRFVVTDRYLLSNVVYQGHAGGLEAEDVWQVGKVATTGIEPDMTFLLDMAPEQAAERLGRDLDRMEQRGDDYRRRLRDGFLDEAARQRETVAVIDAAGSVQSVHNRINLVASRIVPGWD